MGPLVLLLQAAFSQPILPESTLWTPLSSTQCPLHQETHNSYWSAQGWGTDHACISYFVLPSTERAISSDSPKFPFCPSCSPHIFWMWEPVLTFSFPPGLLAPFLIPFLFFFLWSYLVVRGFFFYPFRCPESSTNVQKVLCENCSICRCILDVIVRRDKFWVLLFCHLDFSLKIFFFNEFCF